MKEITALGVMSGSSLDGVDLALCRFSEEDAGWHFQILKAETYAYPEEWQKVLSALPLASAKELVQQDVLYGRYLGTLCSDFLKKYSLTADLIASHGHTIFHNPKLGYTFQLGNGQALANTSGLPTVCDFRTQNVLTGGQGAPLVPIGDALLFGDMDYCLNLGGIANISFHKNGRRLAYDLCPANQLLNFLSQQVGKPYDLNGNLARNGKPVPGLLATLNSNPYYQQELPKSLGNEYVRETFLSVLAATQASTEDLLYNSVKHIAFQVAQVFGNNKGRKVLVTGGGAHNSFLMESLRQETPQEFIVPDQELVDFKEALIFALMGVLRLTGQPNCLASYTGTDRDLSTGRRFLPEK